MNSIIVDNNRLYIDGQTCLDIDWEKKSVGFKLFFNEKSEENPEKKEVLYKIKPYWKYATVEDARAKEVNEGFDLPETIPAVPDLPVKTRRGNILGSEYEEKLEDRILGYVKENQPAALIYSFVDSLSEKARKERKKFTGAVNCDLEHYLKKAIKNLLKKGSLKRERKSTRQPYLYTLPEREIKEIKTIIPIPANFNGKNGLTCPRCGANEVYKVDAKYEGIISITEVNYDIYSCLKCGENFYPNKGGDADGADDSKKPDKKDTRAGT